ncbi:hypothetical protein [Legionella sp. W05-934-2]|uniref:hypothetical protein n=1 Tax=Legionella sp. W05-934-2 TaxID=1198649 RepID=UPI00346342F2
MSKQKPLVIITGAGIAKQFSQAGFSLGLEIQDSICACFSESKGLSFRLATSLRKRGP